MTSAVGLNVDIVEKVLQRLGFQDWPKISVEGLQQLYRSWCRNVPYDNIQKRIYFVNIKNGPMPIGTPAEFFEAYLKSGTGGTCWPHCIGVYSLLKSVGFDVRGAAGSMVGLTPPENGPSHGTVICTLEGQEYLVDGSLLIEEIVPLYAERESVAGPHPLTVTVRPNRFQLWDIDFRMAHSDKMITCQLEVDNVDLNYYHERWENTRNYSLFNGSLYVRKNIDGGALTFGRGKLIHLYPDGSLATELVHEQDKINETLYYTFGLSEEIIDRLPADDEGAKSMIS